ncbi:hypothetical protein EIN_161710 [Entamoeba invadens IP1]|uniref:Uncharacterized protein n=1 Tax=Entamoeba invadens IP1 TaxID=370355 RepID=A0A0A1U1R6_ENTIV|nr:hypothetical protein EIN_161710 [Entamoeba invadens IP1]ELP86557.1 hypothetical protein EIN_161710 [Entamoeba invadens IP1]|eukprot:XP_004185903.1 hypothetical protein EIN_161710 [Entamoeba invadens IP1]
MNLAQDVKLDSFEVLLIKNESVTDGKHYKMALGNDKNIVLSSSRIVIGNMFGLELEGRHLKNVSYFPYCEKDFEIFTKLTGITPKFFGRLPDQILIYGLQ